MSPPSEHPLSVRLREAHNPQRNVPRALVLTCLVTGVLAAIEVYLGQLVWHNSGCLPGGGCRCPR